ncbi:MAG: type IV pilin protein [Pseudomonas sp.]|uniref:type IV pilin protein n=1 Tax=Pseudomonas sp. TaxID=306 RepID=UPI00339B239C
MIRSNKGFTLMELMIVVAIIAILGAVAYPTYVNSVIRGNRSEGNALLNNAAAAQEKFSSQNTRYATTLAELRLTANSTNSLYQLAIVPNANPGQFSLTATPIGKQLGDTECAVLGLDHLGNRTVTGTKSAQPQDCFK